MSKPPSVTIFAWLRGNLGPRCLAPLTSTDSRALQAAVQIIEIYAYDRDPKVLEAFAVCVQRMQPQCQQFAFHAIVHVMEWTDRASIWSAAKLPVGSPVFNGNPWRCKFE